MQVETETLIDAPPDVVFKTLTDVARWPEMIPGIRLTEILTDGPIRVGTRFREVRDWPSRETTADLIIAEFEPPRRFVTTTTRHGTAYLAIHTLERREAGTLFKMRLEARPFSIIARLLRPLGWLMRGSMRRMLKEDVAALKAVCEGRSRA